ncbi:hypothetical protein JJE66_19980 [Bradyrhizobium diazoefficiens]|uniref:hypothetical protein n=1 Tax=Bradyrhizobium diazoefficiens TaxID=1355477 RepID=UPI00190D0B6A|nr:hypothetical protein [Bradyrhizobium diazoefficiens]MBK3663489.1 hypothetical protein [Bradyrhizobium diazoefficiens]
MAQTLKTNLMMALAIGFLISTVFMSIPSMRDGTSDWSGVEFPGMAAAYLFWGALSDSVFWGTVIGWAANAVVYSLPAFAVVSIFTALKSLQLR